MRQCFDLIKERPTLSKALLGFESGVVTLSEVRKERASVVGPQEPRGTTEVWVPSAERDRSKAMLREQWLHPRLTRLRIRAQLVYEEFMQGERSLP